MSSQKKRKQTTVYCSGKLLVGCTESSSAAFLCNTCKTGLKYVSYDKCRFSKFFVFEDETTKTICSNPEVRFQKFKFVYGKYHLFCFESVESACSAQKQLFPDIIEVEKIVPREVYERDWPSEEIPFQYSGKHHKLLPKALPKPADSLDSIELLHRVSLRSSSRSSMIDIDDDKSFDDPDSDIEAAATVAIERSLETASRGIEEAQLSLLRLKRQHSRSSSVDNNLPPGSPPPGEGSLSPTHLSTSNSPSPSPRRGLGMQNIRMMPQISIPQGPPTHVWDQGISAEPMMQVGRIPVRHSSHTPFQDPSADDPMIGLSGYEEGEVPPEMEYAFRASIVANEQSDTDDEAQTPDEDSSESETDEEYVTNDADTEIQLLQNQIEVLKLQKQAKVVSKSRLFMQVLKKDGEASRGRSRRRLSQSRQHRRSRSSSATGRTGSPRRKRNHRRSSSQHPQDSSRPARGSARRTHSVDILNSTQIMRRHFNVTNEGSPTARARRNSGKDRSLVRLRDMLKMMANSNGAWVQQEQHQYLKWKVDYCPQCERGTEVKGSICIHCSANTECCVEDKFFCEQNNPLAENVDHLPAKTRKKLSRRFSYYLNGIVTAR